MDADILAWRCPWLRYRAIVVSIRSDNKSSNNKFRARITVSLSWITESAWPFFWGCWAALDEATLKKGLAKAVCESNGNGSSEQGKAWLCNFFGIFGHCARAWAYYGMGGRKFREADGHLKWLWIIANLAWVWREWRGGNVVCLHHDRQMCDLLFDDHYYKAEDFS